VALGAVVAFRGTSFLLVLTPGADWAYMITAGLRNRGVGQYDDGVVRDRDHRRGERRPGAAAVR
jgi:hypothetical protein